MNIGIVTVWGPTGAGYVSKAYEQVLSDEHNVLSYARGGRTLKDDPMWDGKNVTWAPYHPCTTGIYWRHFSRWIQRIGIEALIFNEQRFWKTVAQARKLGILIGAYVDYYTADTIPFFDLYDFLICHTRRHYGVFKSHPQVLYCPWGTDIRLYRPTQTTKDRPTTFLISAGWSGAHARKQDWMDRRGVGMTIRAFRRINADVRLVILSQVPLEACPIEWQRAVAEDKRINFVVGTYHPVPYSLGDVYVYPSRLDGIGLTVPEALSSGLPVITTDSAPMNEFVIQGENGLLVDVERFSARPDGYYWPESICREEALIDAMLYYIHNPSMIHSHAINARMYAEKHLNWAKNALLLKEWLSRQRRRNLTPASYRTLKHKVERYDLRNNPTPIERILVGFQGLIRQLSRLRVTSLWW